jgi:O-antigen ligase
MPGAARGTVAGVAVVLVVAGVVAGVDPWGMRPYTTLRWALVGVAATLAAAAVRWRAPRPIVVLGAALLGWLALATATAVDPVVALVGHPRRHLGLAAWIVCALALLAGTGLGGRVPRRMLVRAVAAGGVLTGVAVAADVVGWDPFGTRFAGGRAGGLLGQPLYLGVVALLVAPVAAGVAADRVERRAWRLAGAAGCAGAVLALTASQTRGAWLGAAVATGLVTARRRHRWSGRRRGIGGTAPGAGLRRRRPAVALAVTALAALGLVLVASGPRLADLADRDAPGGIGRLDEWRVAVGVVADHPVTGVGPEGYRIAAPAHIDDGYTRRHGRDEVVDRAHSAPLDVAATAGVPAALLYVGLIGWVVVRCARVIGRSSDPVLVGLGAAVAAWSAQLLVGFPIAEVDPLAWLFAGVVVVAPSARAGTAGDADTTPGDGAVAPRPQVRQALLAALAVALAAGGVTAVAADRALARAEDARARGDIAGALRSADAATELRPDDIDAWYLAARIAATPEGLPALDNALDRLEEALDRLPGDPALRHLQTALLAERAQRSGLADDLAAAEASARDLVADDPSSPAAHRALGLTLAAGGRPGAARAALARAVALDPEDAVARAALDDGDGDGDGGESSG